MSNRRCSGGYAAGEQCYCQTCKDEELIFQDDPMEAPVRAATQVTLRDGSTRKARGPNLSPLEKAQKNPKSLRAAIDAKCFQCQGDGEDPGTWERVRTCTIPDCGLYLLRRK